MEENDEDKSTPLLPTKQEYEEDEHGFSLSTFFEKKTSFYDKY